VALNGQELEVKFIVMNLAALESRLKFLGAGLIQPRLLETNLRFDTPELDLARSARVLRLRMDTAPRLTYKGPGQEHEGAQLRQELEFTVGDFEMAKALFEALGFQVVVIYEKFRTTYSLHGTLVTLDEMPFGNFVEIEGENGQSIHEASERLRLDWDRRILEGYIMLFERLKSALGLSFRDLTFANFAGSGISAFALDILAGDE
jgi:adenylate cyclase class 2